MLFYQHGRMFKFYCDFNRTLIVVSLCSAYSHSAILKKKEETARASKRCAASCPYRTITITSTDYLRRRACYQHASRKFFQESGSASNLFVSSKNKLRQSASVHQFAWTKKKSSFFAKNGLDVTELPRQDRKRVERKKVKLKLKTFVRVVSRADELFLDLECEKETTNFLWSHSKQSSSSSLSCFWHGF